MIKDKALIMMLKGDYIGSHEITDLVVKYQKARKAEKKQEYKDKVFQNIVRMISKRSQQHASRNRHLDADDLFQAGVIGFCEAIEKFQISKKVVFTTYLDFWIQKYMYDVAYDDNLIYTPKNVIQHAFQQHKLEIEGKKTDYNDRSRSFINTKNVVFLDATHDSSGGGSWHEIIKSGVEIDTDIENRSQTEHLMNLISKHLNPNEQKVIKLRYFHKHGDVLGLQTIGEMINLSTERVRQIEAKAIKKLKRRTKGLIQ